MMRGKQEEWDLGIRYLKAAAAGGPFETALRPGFDVDLGIRSDV